MRSAKTQNTKTLQSLNIDYKNKKGQKILWLDYIKYDDGWKVMECDGKNAESQVKKKHTHKNPTDETGHTFT